MTLFSTLLEPLQDRKLAAFWIFRSTTTALYALFGALLSAQGHAMSDIMFAWSLMYALQLGTCVLVDKIRSSLTRQRTLRALCYASVSLSVVSLLIGLGPLLMAITFACLCAPLREINTEGMAHVRERRWKVSANMATGIVNELSRAFGSVSTVVLGALVSVNPLFVAVYLLAMAVMATYTCRRRQGVEVASAAPSRPRLSGSIRWLVGLSATHNAVFFTLQGYLSLVSISIFLEGGLENQSLGLYSAIAGLSGLVLILLTHAFRRARGASGPPMRSRLAYQAILAQCALGALTLWPLVGFVTNTMSATLVAGLIAASITAIAALGGLYTVGFMCQLDRLLGQHPQETDKLARRHTYNLNFSLGRIGPVFAMAGLGLATLTTTPIESATAVISALVLFDVLVAGGFWFLSRRGQPSTRMATYPAEA